MRIIRSISTLLCVGLAFCATAVAQEAQPAPSVLITNANIFDGKSDTLATGMSVLVEGNKIKQIGKSITAPAGATVINANGRTMTPGLIDMHVHLMWNLSPEGMFDGMPDYLGARTLADCKATLCAAIRAFAISPARFSGRSARSTKAISKVHGSGPVEPALA